MKKDLVSISDLSGEEIKELFKTAIDVKHKQMEVARGKTLVLVFEKPSLRTRVTFSVAFFQLGGQVLYLAPADIGLGKRESVPDVARNLSRWVNAISARTFAHKTVEDLAKYADTPVVNALSDAEHPCQALADFLTIYEHKGKTEGLKMAFLGDGNNVAHSLMLTAAKVGANMAVGCPKGYEPKPEFVEKAKEDARKSGAELVITSDPKEAVKGADVVYTDVWASMGQEDEAAARKKIFAPYQVNAELLKLAKSDALVEHCLPAHRGDEITDDVLDGPHSVVLDEAENRLHIQKAILYKLLARN
ncbi:ornithine carbamoyltransferase [bacterium]|nr:ornithine carbamoyltransferase [bacterium]